ncbi:TonB-dependent hemoglobin/transferrin/lactoferrin family receptor [Ensifer adhaerens]|uniref:TonB-dependent hemoglobin/transferrin/lactoferrin family receptor n=1 Tax=Ensifer adhaerens TaxID=106592 RepID=UPI001CBB9EEE|nr:TonB-dependent hemoglobin/transferrin/lactoferrin family receptor [Ensifer adhaerens]MBZ7924359.1 TonB-dependent hemoglobin/transferrin/lactoferrin family receptor [Ensifer adhaerens]UAX96392.1 TonB-dependent hemoglobin/transferrin/lactoferrin family receptor [Ensifer adhaerens]UAY04265.1 TonB-dependent hemoglobin/transferrin/lactoferrin family receptor [Ensifer adhaerens]UAY12251.1 TonB-dependent hemoglobin/transferrin/lactoferrin family receptor [Ensifer adhaerens]
MIDRRFRTVLLACAAFAAVCLPKHSQAQQRTTNSTASAATSQETTLQKIVVKGKRLVQEGSVSDSPATTVTTRATLEKKQVDELKDFGNTVDPSVTYNEASKSVNIRGLEQDRVLTLTDGIPIPYFFDDVYRFGGGADTYDFNSLASVDVLHSADSSRAGSGALGGALVLNTLEPEDLITDGNSYGGQIKFGYAGSDRSLTAAGAVAAEIRDTSILFQSSYKRGHETKTGGDVAGTGVARTIADPLRYYQRNYLFKLRQGLEGGHTIGVTAEHYSHDSNKDFRSYSGYRTATGYSSYNSIVEMTRDRVSLDYEYEAESSDSLVDSAFATLYWQRSARDEGTLGVRKTAPLGEYDRVMQSGERDLGFKGYANSAFETGALNHELTFGTDFQFSQTDYYLFGIDNCATSPSAGCAFYHTNQNYAPDVNSYKFGLYADDKISLGDSQFSLTPGVRFDWYKQDPQETAGFAKDLPDGQSGTHLSPKVRASWTPSPDSELYAQFVTAFKAPSTYQLYVDYDNHPYYRSIGNPELKPESSWGFEVGANFGDEDQGARISAYSTRYRNFIDSTGLDRTIDPSYLLGVQTYENKENVRISGVQLEGHQKFANGMQLHGALYYARGMDLDDDSLLASVAPLKAIVGVGYEKETWGTDLTMVASAAVSEKSQASSKPPGYGVINLTAWWQPEQLSGMTVQGGVYNIFDKTYFDALEVKNVTTLTDLYSEAGRYFKVAVSQRF